MNAKRILFGSLSLLAVASSQGEELSLADLAARLEQLENKVNKYEAQYGPLGETPPAAVAPQPNIISLPTPASQPVLTPAEPRRC